MASWHEKELQRKCGGACVNEDGRTRIILLMAHLSYIIINQVFFKKMLSSQFWQTFPHSGPQIWFRNLCITPKYNKPFYLWDTWILFGITENVMQYSGTALGLWRLAHRSLDGSEQPWLALLSQMTCCPQWSSTWQSSCLPALCILQPRTILIMVTKNNEAFILESLRPFCFNFF